MSGTEQKPGSAPHHRVLGSILAAAGPAPREAVAVSLGGALVQSKVDREVYRVPEGGVVFWVKWFGPERADEGRAERDAYRRLAVTGIPAAALLDDGERHDGATALLLEDAGPGLDEVLCLEGHLAAKRRMRLERAARTVAALHGGGFTFPDLLARHLRVGVDGEVRLIDLARLEGPGRVDPMKRAEDLGAFLGTLPRLAVPERERLRWFRLATGDLDAATRRRLAERVVKQTAKTRARTRHRHRAMEVRPDMRRLLLDSVPGALSFDTWFKGEVGVRLRRLRDRENRRLKAGGVTFFLKRHFDGSRAAVEELEASLAFRRAGLPAVLPAAVGEDVDTGSFWLADAAEGAPLDEVLAEGNGVPVAARRELAGLLGEYAARLRRAGRFHRDFYLNHWIGCWTAEKGWTLSLIDLQRAGRTGLRSERWFVKDAAQLWHSARRTTFTRTDAVRFLRACFGLRRLDDRARTFARRVLRKAASMASRTPRTPLDGDTR